MTEAQLATSIYQRISAADKPRPYKHWHASSMSKCPREHYMLRMGVKPLETMSAARILRNQAGHFMEAAIREPLKEMYPNLISNKRYTNKILDLTGEIDNYDPDSQSLIEIKTVGVRAVRYKRVTEDKYNLKDDSPYLSHEYQQHTYVILMANENLPVKNITYLYISLEGLLIPYTTEVNQSILANVGKRISILNEAWSKEEVPDCICDESHPLWGSMMKWCSYRVKNGECCSLELLS